MIVVCYIPLVKAQTPTDTAKKVQQINDVIVTGQYGESSISKSVYKVRVIDQKRIQLQGANNLKDVLTNELNVRVSNDPALGGSVSIQGISGQNIKIMIDGVPVVGREGGLIDLNQINLNNIERIELIEGPMSVNFGTDALGGVINLISKKYAKGYRVGATSYMETIGKYNFGVNGGFTKGKWNVNATFARNFFDGYSPDESTRVRLWKPSTQYFGDMSVGKSINNGTLRYSLSAFNEKVTSRNEPTITPYYAYANDNYFYTQRITNSLFYDQKLNKKFQLNIIGSYNYYRRIVNTVHKDSVSLEEQPVSDTTQHDTVYFYNVMSRGTLSHSNPNKKWDYQTGYELNHDINSGTNILNGKQTMTDVSAFGSMEIRSINRLLIRPGLRVIYNSKFNAPLIPSLNVKWNVTEHISIRGSYGKGFRAPSLKELYLEFVDPNHNVHGNPNLQAETQDNFQTSALFEWKKFERVFRIEPALYYNHIHNKIDLVLINSATLETQYRNFSEYKSTGTSITTEYRAPRYALVLGYAYNGINNTLQQSTATNEFFFSNEVRANLNYTFKKPSFTFSVFYKYNGKQRIPQYDILTGNIINGYIDAYNLLDLSVNKSFIHNTLTFTVGAKNVLDVVNVNANITSGVHGSSSNNAAIGMGRTFFISCAYNLAWNKK